jgi:soluble lytic murein transglycosylase-like protein
MKKNLIPLFLVFTMACAREKPEAYIETLFSESQTDRFTLSFRNNDIFNNTDNEENLIRGLHHHGFGASYYASYITEADSKPELTMRLLENELETDSAWHERAALRYGELFFEKDYRNAAEAGEAAAKLDTLINQLPKSLPLLYSRAVLAFYDKDYDKVLKLLSAAGSSDKEQLRITRRCDWLLGVSAAMLKQSPAPVRLNNFFFNYKPSPLTEETLIFLEKELVGFKQQPLYPLYRAMARAHSGSVPAAFNTLTAYFQQNPATPLIEENPDFLSNYTDLALRSSRSRIYRTSALDPRFQALITLDALAAERPAATEYALYAARGRLENALKNFDAAQENFEKSLAGARSAGNYDDILLKMADISFSRYFDHERQRFINDMAGIAVLWKNPESFASFLSKVITELTARRDFESINTLYTTALKNRADTTIQSRCAWILARAVRHGLIAVRNNDGTAAYQLLLSEAQADPFSYYAFMAAVLGHKTPAVLRSIKNRHISYTSLAPQLGRRRSMQTNEPHKIFAMTAALMPVIDTDFYALGFLCYELNKNPAVRNKIMYKVNSLRPAMSTDALRLMAKELNIQHEWLYSYAAMSRARLRDNFIASRADYEILYPRAYENEIMQAAETAGVNINILFGLIRQESGFTPDIVSQANAVGLSQVLPSTASDMNYKLRLKNYDLTDPLTNLMFGTSYINWLEERLEGEGMSRILLGYNGGFGNARKWLRQWPDLPPEIALEAIPFNESRNYVKIILTSAVTYNYLYEDGDSMTVVQTVYPGIS